MKICYITHDIKKNTGNGIFSRNLAETVLKLRPMWQIDFLTDEDSGTGDEKYIISFRKKDVLKNFFQIRRILRSYNLIHVMDAFPYGFVVVLATIGIDKPVFATAVGSGSIFTPDSVIRNLALRVCYKMADKIFAISSYVSQKIMEVMPSLEIHVINLGLGQKFEEVSGHLDLPQPYILTVGYLKRRKGYEYSIKAFAKSLESNSDLHYVIVGNRSDSEYEKEILNLVADLGIASKVHFLKNLTSGEMDSVYSHAKLFLLMPQETPNDIEGFGMVYLEAASHGLPVIGSSGSSAEDAVLNGKNGLLVPAGDIEAITEAINRILGDKNLARQFSEESKRFASIMTWEKTAREYVEYYEKL